MKGYFFCTLVVLLWSYTCGHAGVHVIPKIPDRFSARLETINHKGKQISEIRVIVDYVGKYMRTDLVPKGRMRNSHFRRYGNRSLIIINDFNTGHEFVIDRYRGNCSISNISVHNFLAQMDGRHMVTGMKHAYGIFQTKNMTYQGDSSFRSLPVEVYGREVNRTKVKIFFLKNPWGVVTEYDGHPSQGVPVGANFSRFENKSSFRSLPVEVYGREVNRTKVKIFFLKNPWGVVTEYDGHPSQGVPVGANFSRFENKTRQWISFMIHVYDFSKDHTELGEQPMTDCFDKSQTYQIRLHGNPGSLRFKGLDVRYALQTALAKNMKVSLIRVSILNILIPVDRVSYPYVYVMFKVFEPIRKKGNLAVPVIEVPSDRAVANLKMAILRGMTVELPNFGRYEAVKVVKSSVKSVNSNPPMMGSARPSRNNAGVVAGVGIALLIVGLGVGFAAAFFFRKRFPCDKAVPYEITK